MIRVEIPKVRAILYGLCRKMYNALQRFCAGAAPAIPLKATSKDSFNDDYQAAVKAEDDFQAGRAATSQAILDRGGVEAEVDAWIGDAKAFVFRKVWGPRWSVNYAQIGFKSGSIETPADNDGRLEVLRGGGSWLERNPDQEVIVKRNPAQKDAAKDIVITSAEADRMEKALDAAINKVAACKEDADRKESARVKADQQLHGRIRLVAEELDFQLDPLDSRWPVFGLNKPGETERPSVVTGVVVTFPAPRLMHVAWPPAERAVRYKVRALVVGKEAEFRTVAEVYEEQADLMMFAPGEVVKVEITAVNGAGESTPSEPVTATQPLAAVA